LTYHDGQFTQIDRQAILEEISRDLNRADSASEAARKRLAARLLDPVLNFYDGWL